LEIPFVTKLLYGQQALQILRQQPHLKVEDRARGSIVLASVAGALTDNVQTIMLKTDHSVYRALNAVLK